MNCSSSRIRNRVLLTTSEQILLPFSMAQNRGNAYSFELPNTFVLSDHDHMGDGWMLDFTVHSSLNTPCFIEIAHPICAPIICANRNVAIACSLSNESNIAAFTPCLTLKAVCVDVIELRTLDVDCSPKTFEDVSRIVLSCCLAPK